MGFLIQAWEMSQQKFTMSMKQVVTNAGDGTLENEESVGELRQFFSLIDLQTMGRLLEECYSKDRRFKFDARGDARRGYAFQDLINEMGRRLGYKVENGLYRGRKNEIGFDGLWKAEDSSHIIMESKTSDDYAISIDAVIGYRDKLIIDHKIPKKKCSILIVYGRDDKMALRNTVRGSSENQNIRLISANALFQLVKIYCELKTDVVLKQISNMLRPRDYFVLDNLVELVFPQTDPEIDAVEETDEEIDNTIQSINKQKPDTKEPPKKTERSKGPIYNIVDDVFPDGCETFHYAGKKVVATGYYIVDTDEFVVFKGSEFSSTETNSCASSTKAFRQRLIHEGIVTDNIFAKSVKFQSPSAAAQVVYGGSQNGRIMWIDKEGRTIRELHDT